MKKRLTAVLLATALLFILGFGNAFAGVPDAPDPFYAADFADVIDEETEDYIIEQNGILENLCGAQIVVVTTDFLDGMNIEDYAYKLFNDWEIGDKDKNNGVLLLLAIGEENYWCMQGRGLENVLTSGDIDDILWENLEPDFAAENYDAGVLSTFDALYDTVYGYYGGNESDGGYGYGEAGTGFLDGYGRIVGFIIKIMVVIVALVVIVTIISLLSRGSGYGGGGYRRKRRPSGSTVYIPPSTGRRKSPMTGTRTSSVRRSSSGSSRSSFGGRHRSSGSGHGGGGRSRGGGAGRRGR